MSKASDKQLQDTHNQAEKDYAEGNGYHTPRFWASLGLSSNDESYQLNEASYKGWVNAKKQDR